MEHIYRINLETTAEMWQRFTGERLNIPEQFTWHAYLVLPTRLLFFREAHESEACYGVRPWILPTGQVACFDIFEGEKLGEGAPMMRLVNPTFAIMSMARVVIRKQADMEELAGEGPEGEVAG